MIRFFVWSDGEKTRYGNEGWLPAWIDSEEFDPSQGLGVAHDFFEHRKSDTGKFEEEIMAFGAMIYVRVMGNYFYRQNNPAAMLGEALLRLYLDQECDIEDLPEPRKPVKLTANSIDGERSPQTHKGCARRRA